MTGLASDVEGLERRLGARIGRAIGDFELIEPGDRILVGISGGKDSWTLLHLLRLLQRRAPVRFDLVALNVDHGFAGFRADIVEDYLAAMHPRLRAENGRHTVIRPLVSVWEDEIVEYVRARRFPVVCCACPGCKDPTLQRHRVEKLLRELERVHPGLKRSLLGALSRVDPGSLPIPTRRGPRPGDLPSVLGLVAERSGGG
ncbi:MAG: hypothetical protein HY002_19010 [Candidatus Rokubacteria bacterium]|nr:hypothetical protein [Candidatus Rokubacteria bacterium]